MTGGGRFGLTALAVALCSLGSPAVAAPATSATITAPSGSPLAGWLRGPIRLGLTDLAARRQVRLSAVSDAPSTDATFTVQWSVSGSKTSLDLRIVRKVSPCEHEVVVELPILNPALELFTPTELGNMEFGSLPTHTGTPYGRMAWDDGACWVLPLVSALDGHKDAGLTVALPPEPSVPHLVVEWRNARRLLLHMGRRGLGAGADINVRLLFYAHHADYRSALKAYADDFAAYFRPGLPRGPYEGTFWYHHIHDQPPTDEVENQDARFVWSSFWFTHLGNYLPDGPTWEPYTFANWWALRRPMDDNTIREYSRDLSRRGIGVFAYFNVTEFGGRGGAGGGGDEAAALLRERFADALMKDPNGAAIPTWEGAMAMSAAPGLSLFPFLQDQVARHLRRLPELAGFCIDRLDWASTLDYGHDDGRTMVGRRHVADMADAVSAGVQEVVRQAHAAGKRVYVNQFYRLEPLKDVDGYCHENDYLLGLNWLSPFRPVSAWHKSTTYATDPLRFEAEMKRRLLWAVFPQMVSRKFPISQQAASEHGAEVVEAYTPLFATLRGMSQALEAHCVRISGANAANLFVAPGGRWVAPVVSRTTFRCASAATQASPPRLSIRCAGASSIRWGKMVSIGRPPVMLAPIRRNGGVDFLLPGFADAAVVVAGTNAEAAVPAGDPGQPSPVKQEPERRLGRIAAIRSALVVWGSHVGARSGAAWLCAGKSSIRLADGANRLAIPCRGKAAPVISTIAIRTRDDGSWFVPTAAEMRVQGADGLWRRAARWDPRAASATDGYGRTIVLRLAPVTPETIQRSTASLTGTTATGGERPIGASRLLAPSPAGEGVGRWRIDASGAPCIWEHPSRDARALPVGGAEGRAAVCWFGSDAVTLRLAPPDRAPHRIWVYILDFDHNGREQTLSVGDEEGALASIRVTKAQADAGTWVAWTVTGPVSITAQKLTGYNAVISAVAVED